MKASPVVVTLLALTVGLSGCAQPRPDGAASEEPVAAPSETAAPQPKPTAPLGDQQFCYDDLLNDPATEEHHGGDVAWPAPLVDDDFPIEPSCWYSTDQSGGAAFAADWRVLGPTDRDLLLTAIQHALAGYGLSVATTDGDADSYHIDTYLTGETAIQLRYDDDFDTVELTANPQS